jgi:hypothetical protein
MGRSQIETLVAEVVGRELDRLISGIVESDLRGLADDPRLVKWIS